MATIEKRLISDVIDGIVGVIAHYSKRAQSLI